jgi:EmrB/QacA subfamily drug resistance transporter
VKPPNTIQKLNDRCLEDTRIAEGTLPSLKAGVLLTTSLVSALIMLDANIVAVSLPAIAQTFGASFSSLEWVISSYLLSYAALLLGAGSFADLCGRKKAMVIGLAVFGLASIACGGATSLLMLNSARVVQGIGASMLLTAALAIITRTFAGPERTHAFAVWGACLGFALTSGPLIGGVITSFLGWRWIFLINIPICIGLIWASLRYLSESRDKNAKRLDIAGIASFTPGLLFLVWALIDGNERGWGSITILLRFAASLACFLVFVTIEVSQERPMVDLSLFRRPTFLGAVLAMVGYGATAQVMVFYLPLFLQNVYGFSPAVAGLGMLPFALPMVLAPKWSSQIALACSGRLVLTFGLAITFLGNILFCLFAGNHLPYAIFVLGMLVSGAGAGILNAETVKSIGAAVPTDRAGMASGIASTARFVGILVGVAGLGAILADVSRRQFLSAAQAAGLDSQAANPALSHANSYNSMGALPGISESLQSQLHLAASYSFASGFAVAGLAAALVAAASSLSAFWLIRSAETAPLGGSTNRICKIVDCPIP